MKILLLMALLPICFAKQPFQESNGLLKVSLFYEALCPGCLDFIKNQLYPSYSKIGSYISLDFTPYGNAERRKENGTWIFDCQHGPDECAINKIEACGLARTNDQDKKMEYVNCVESQAEAERKNPKVLAKCATKLGLTAVEILKCSQGPEGDELLARLADKQAALHPKIEYVPWLLFNDVYNATMEEHALNNFLRTVCDILFDQPEGCSETNEIPIN